MHFAAKLSFRICMDIWHYLGIPASLRSLKANKFLGLLTRMLNRTATWNVCNFFFAGRLTLVYSVYFYVNSYISSCWVLVKVL